jgi:amidase
MLADAYDAADCGAFNPCKPQAGSALLHMLKAEQEYQAVMDVFQTDESLISLKAFEVLALIERGAVSPLDLLDALERRIAAVDGSVNALPTLCFERARMQAKALMRKPMVERGLLKGMPIPIKDLTEVAGVRTTYGSPIYAGHVPGYSDPLVERLEEEGGLVYAKSNTPEFGAGANTFNEVFGFTRNPWDTRCSAAGSSGGAAVSLATGMAWLAHGSDLGGSLRNPASFCGIVGLRPTPGRVATDPGVAVDRRLPVEGPMARCVEDVALLLDAMSGEDIRDPVSLPKPAHSFLSGARSGWRPARVAFSATLGFMPVDPQVAEITQAAALRFAEAGSHVEEAHPDCSEVHACFEVLRASFFASSKKALLETQRDKLKPEVIWNIERGLQLTMADIVRAEEQRAALMWRMLAFFGEYDLICAPATIVPPYPVEQRFVAECGGVRFENYVQWLGISYAFTLAGCPALSLPCGFTREGLPVGLQLVAPPRGEHRLLAAAKVLEDILDLKTHKPILPRVRHLAVDA